MGNTISAAMPPTKQRVFLGFILFAVLFFSFFDRINISVMIADPAFLKDMGLVGNPVKMGMLTTVFLIVYCSANIILGGVGDWLGPRKAISLCLPVWALAMVVGGFAPSFAWIMTSRIILGVGESVHWPVQMKYVRNWFPSWERAKANAAWQLGIYMGPALAMPVFAYLISAYGWRNTFFIVAISTAIPLSLIYFLTTDHPHENKRCNEAERKYIEDALAAEREQDLGKVTLSFKEGFKKIVTNVNFWMLVLYFHFNAAGTWGIFAWMPAYLKQARGFSWKQMGYLSALPYVAGALALLISSILSDKVGRRAPFCFIGMIIQAISLYMATTVTDNMSSAYWLGVAVFGNGMALPATWTMLQKIVPPEALSAGSGLMNGLGNFGSALAVVLMGYIIKSSFGFSGAMMYLCGCTALAALFSLPLLIKKY